MNKIGWTSCLILLTALNACTSDNDEELQHYMQKIKTRPLKPIEPIPEFVSPSKFAYPEEDKRRSPFKPLKVEEKKKDVFAPDINRPKQPLEAFPLDALKFVGTLKEGAIIWGLISQPDGLVTRVKPGDYMGKNYGQIIRITEDSIKLEETVQISGQWEKRPMTLNLAK